MQKILNICLPSTETKGPLTKFTTSWNIIAYDNEKYTCISVSEEVDITDNEHGDIFAQHVPCNDDIIVISSDWESDISVSILKIKK